MAVNPQLAVIFLMLTMLTSEGETSQPEDFDYTAVMEESGVPVQVEDLTAVLARLDAKKCRPVIEQMGSTDFDEREKAMKRLEAMGPKVVPLLKKYGLKSPDLEIRVRTRSLISKINEDGTKFFLLCRAAITALGKLKATNTVKLIGEYLYADNPTVRSAAAQALNEIGGRAARGEMSRCIRRAVKSKGAVQANVLETLEIFAADAGGRELDEIAALIGQGSRTVDLYVLEILAERGKVKTWVDASRKYAAAWQKDGSAPPQFIRIFLAAAYGLDSDKKIDWAALCKGRGKKIRTIPAGKLKFLRAEFLAGIEREKQIARYEECFRFVHARAGGIWGVDINRLRGTAILRDFEKYIGEDKACAAAVKILAEKGGAFHTDLMVGYLNINIANGQEGVCLIARGNYDSAKQTKLYARLYGWETINYDGIDYISQKKSMFGHSTVCFYDNKYVILCYSFFGFAPMERVLDTMRGRESRILPEKNPGKMLNRETLTSQAWCVGMLDKILIGARGSGEEDVLKLLQAREFAARLSIIERVLTVKVRGRCKDTQSAKDIERMIGKYVGIAVDDLGEEIEDTENIEWPYSRNDSEEIIDLMKSVRKFLPSVKTSANGDSFTTEAVGDLSSLYRVINAEVLPELTKAIIDKMEDYLPVIYVLESRLKWAKDKLNQYRISDEKSKRKLEEFRKEAEILRRQPDLPESIDRLREIESKLEWHKGRSEWDKERMERLTREIERLEEQLRIEKTSPDSQKHDSKKPQEGPSDTEPSRPLPEAVPPDSP